jgi:hypothetical protein
MLDFDEILVSVKNPQIQKYLEESIKSYRVGNYRSAILAVWIAAMFDLVKKFEILVEQREPTAVEKWKNLEQKIANHQNWEKELIHAAKEVSMISRYESDTLGSLSKTRNRYAHPSFDEVGSLFDPTPEEVRYFIRTLYDIVLSQPAQLGTFYINQLLESIKNPTFFSSQLIVNELTELKNSVVEKVNRINVRQTPRLVKELFQALISPSSVEHKLNILCLLINIWGATTELQAPLEVSTYWNDYILSQELDLKILEGILNYPECVNELSDQAQEKIGSAFRSQFLKRRQLSESATKFLAAADVVPLAQSISNDAASLIPLDKVIEQSFHYTYLFGEKFPELFGKDIRVLKTCNGYAVNPVLAVLRRCGIWALADTLPSEEQTIFGSELIDSLNCNNWGTMSLLSFDSGEDIPIKWVKILFEQWLNKLHKNSQIQKSLFTYLEYFLGLFKRYTDELNDYTQSREVIQIINDHASKSIADLQSNELLWMFWKKISQEIIKNR